MLSSIIRATSKMAVRSAIKPAAFVPVRQFSSHPTQVAHILIPCDPNFVDEEVIAVFNPVTKEIEPVIVAVPEPSFEFLYCSPVDLHTMDVVPVAKDCIDPELETYQEIESQ